MTEEMNAIMFTAQIITFAAGGVWVVATIKSRVDNLVKSIDELRATLDKTHQDVQRQGQKQQHHEVRISRLEQSKAS